MVDYNVDGMNKHIVEANIKLQDENRFLKEDVAKLKLRIIAAIEYIKRQQLHKIQDKTGGLTMKERELIGILKGKVVYNNEKIWKNIKRTMG